ncbi:hypothetical protein [Shewanella salipaludis]|uniref:Uncharacterized protein n=1 Tax=Shewanella salipaludis TaxID=2723052 RepID=A0A972FYG4_9GAMM|nr:hypothetical protein [Shewanella salipaludis]NMH64967.1 hypothetical protein [Shewanella salipaludis]
MQNIELFNLAAKEILGMCYESFPNRVQFDSYKITNKVVNYYDHSELNAGKAEEISKVCHSTAEWLEQANYIWVRMKAGNEFHSVTLTPKAFELLNLMPESLKIQESLGSVLMKGAKTTAKTGALAAVKVLFSEGVKMIN